MMIGTSFISVWYVALKEIGVYFFLSYCTYIYIYIKTRKMYQCWINFILSKRLLQQYNIPAIDIFGIYPIIKMLNLLFNLHYMNILCLKIAHLHFFAVILFLDVFFLRIFLFCLIWNEIEYTLHFSAQVNWIF